MPAKRKANEEPSKDLQEIRRSTRKLAKYSHRKETAEPMQVQNLKKAKVSLKLMPPLPCMPPSPCTPPLPPAMHAPPLWTEFLTHACENVTLPQLHCGR